MRSDELRTFRSLMERLAPLLKKDKHVNLEPKRDNLFTSIQEESSAVNYSQNRGESTLKLFRTLSNNDRIQLEDLNTLVNTLEKQESISENIKKFSPEFQTKEEHEDANDILETIA